MFRTGFALLWLSVSTSAFAQNWAMDARQIGLGAIGGTKNLATEMIEDEHPYGSIVLPFGLYQLFRDSAQLNPGSTQFDIVRTVEYAIAPFHYVVGRDSTHSTFIVDLGNALLNRDLNAYRGFVPANQPSTGGLASPTIGGGITVRRNERGDFHRVYVGGGPYVALRGSLTTDEQLTRILGSGSPVYVPNAQLQLAGQSQLQAAMAITLGYRGKLSWPEGFGGETERDGLYVAFNYNFLGGLRFEDFNTGLRLDTDGSGLLTLNLFLPSPLSAQRDYSSSGRGQALDFGLGAVIGKWELGLGMNGVANHITWTDVHRSTYSLGSLLSGNANFVQVGPVSLPDRDVTLPIDTRGSLAYHADGWSLMTAAGHGFNGATFHAGYERRFPFLALRVGGFHSSGRWQPTAGIGVPIGSRVALDLAVYGTSANVELERHAAVAASVRINAPTLSVVRSR